MKKKLNILTIMFLCSILTSNYVNADPSLHDEYHVGADYACYDINGVYVLTPKYYTTVTTSNEDDVDSLEFTSENVILNFISRNIREEETSYLKKEDGIDIAVLASYFSSLIKKQYPNIETSLNIESLVARGVPCVLTTTELPNTNVILKTSLMCIEQYTDLKILMIYMLYDKSLENTRYVNDFYRYLYEDPIEIHNKNTLPQKYIPVVTQPIPQASTNNSDLYQGMRDYVDSLDRYIDGLEQIDNGDYVNGLGNMIGWLGEMYEWEEKYGY